MPKWKVRFVSVRLRVFDETTLVWPKLSVWGELPYKRGEKKDRHSGHSLQMIQSTQTQTPVKYCNSAETKSIVRACLFFKDLAKQGDTESVG